jgi:predicted DNA binding protein
MKGAAIKIGDRECLLSEASKEYVGIEIYVLHRHRKRNVQRGLCKVVGKNTLRKEFISYLSDQDTVEELTVLDDNTKDTKIFLVIDPPKNCRILDWINETNSFAKDIVSYRHGIEEWLLYSSSVQNLRGTISKLEEKHIKVKVERFFDLPLDMVFNRSFDFLANMGLTKRQLEILKKAWYLGYYDKQKKATLKEIADQFNVSEPTVWESLRSTEYKIMNSLSDYFIFDF